MSWTRAWHALRGRDRDDALRCALCGKPRAAVYSLVAGEHGAVCNACIIVSLAQLDAVPGDPGVYVRHALVHLLNRIVTNTPLATTAPLVEAASVLAGDRADALRGAAAAAYRVYHFETARALYARIPAAEVTASDIAYLAWAVFIAGDVAGARREIERVDPASIDGDALLWWKSVHSAALVALGDPAGEEEARGLERALASQPDFKPEWAASIPVTLALAEHKRGRHQEAVARLNALGDRLPVRGCLVLGDAQRALGAFSAAAAAYQKVVDGAPMGTKMQADAAQRLQDLRAAQIRP